MEDESSQDEAKANVSTNGDLEKDKGYESTGSDVQDANQYNAVTTIAKTTSQTSSLASVPESLLSIAGHNAPEIMALWHEAIGKIPLEPLERNLRRMLVRLTKDLMDEARSAKGRRVAWFVMSKAASTATLICDEIGPDSRKSIFKETTPDTSGDSEMDEDEHADLKCFRKLIPNSWAFVTFRANVQRFIRPSQLDRSKHHERRTRDLFSALPFYNPKQVLTRPEYVPIKRSSGGFLKYLNQKINTWFKNPRLEKGMKRVTWTCSCGASLYDDYEELEKGAAKRFQKTLQRQFVSGEGPSPIADSECPRQGLYQYWSLGSLIFGLMTTVYTSFRNIRRNNSSLPSYEPEPQHQQSLQAKPQRHASTEQLYLLLCIGNGTGTSATKAYQPTVHDVDSDQKLFQKLFQKLRNYHTSIRKCWWSWLCLRELQHIYFVYFDMYDNSLVDIREVNAVPPAEFDTTYRYERS
ncbi:hypothetical protein EG329_007435 [Mollisiaceae sp. DMI_Dod_QoI]|nr:hypothetical protein EG329_007435 [Helotiales sp. DMI_Dod_QoI]